MLTPVFGAFLLALLFKRRQKCRPRYACYNGSNDYIDLSVVQPIGGTFAGRSQPLKPQRLEIKPHFLNCFYMAEIADPRATFLKLSHQDEMNELVRIITA
ncbi:MAG: hypothetical protein ACI9Y1_001373 [Lentisphaeria bacterium]